MLNLLLLFRPLFGPEGFRDHFQPFTDVLREIWPGVTRKVEYFVSFAVEAAVSAAKLNRLRVRTRCRCGAMANPRDAYLT